MTAPTKARLAALQWFHDRGEVPWRDHRHWRGVPTQRMITNMKLDGQLSDAWQQGKGYVYTLTDAGRQALHEGTRV